MAGYTNKVNERLDGLSGMITNQQEAISKLVDDLVSNVRETASMTSIFMTVIKRFADYLTVINSVGEFREGVESLVHGFLDPAIISQDTMRETITSIDAELQANYPGARLLSDEVSFYYSFHDYVFVRHGNRILIQVNFPITTVQTAMTIYQLTSFPIPVSTESPHVTQLTNLPKFFIARQNYPLYIIPEDGLVYKTSAFFDLTSDKSAFRSYENSPTCVSSLFLDDLTLIKEYCKFRLHLGAIMPNAYLLTDKLMLLVNITALELTCRNNDKRVVVPGCAACLRTVMCGCSVGVKVGNKTAFYFPPKTNKCHKNSTIWAHIANLAVLTAFFKSEDLGSLAGASVVEHQLQLHLPKFSTFSHEYQDFVAHDDSLHYDLHKFAESVKNHTTVYHGLAEVMIDRRPYAQIQPTILSSFWGASIAEYAPLLQIIVFFLSISAFAIGVVLCYRVRVISAALALSHTVTGARAQSTSFPKVLHYFGPTLPSVNSTGVEMQWFNLWEPSHISHGMLLVMLLTVMVLLLLHQRYLSDKYDGYFLALELGDGQRVTRIRCLRLKSAAGAYEIHFDKSVEMLFASILPPKLFIKWQTISIYHSLLNEQIPFPKVVSLNVIQAWKVRKMLTQRFYCVPLLIAGSKALLIRPSKTNAHSREVDEWDETTATAIAVTATAPGLD